MLSFKINKLDIFQSYFFGKVEFRNDKYKINIQNQKRGKVLKLPFEIKPKKKSAYRKIHRSKGSFCRGFFTILR